MPSTTIHIGFRFFSFVKLFDQGKVPQMDWLASLDKTLNTPSQRDASL